MEERGTLKIGEPHPSVEFAKEIIFKHLAHQPHIQEALSSCAIGGNRFAEICGETLRRLLNHEPVSDRYLMGLALFLQEK
jgi:hypothetical protein